MTRRYDKKHGKRSFTLTELMVSAVLMAVLGLILSQTIVSLAKLYYSSITESQLRRDGIAALDKIVSELASSKTNITLNQYSGTAIQFPMPIKWNEYNPPTYWKGWPGWGLPSQANQGTWEFQYNSEQVRFIYDAPTQTLLRIQPAPDWPPDAGELPYDPIAVKAICKNVIEFSVQRVDTLEGGLARNEFWFDITLQKIIPFLKINVVVNVSSKGLSRNDEQMVPFNPSDYPLCGNTYCDIGAGETNATCPPDCPPCDNDCLCDTGETFAGCPNDCPPPGLCGNGDQDSDDGETACNCPVDFAVCGNGTCESLGGENFANCCRDCGSTTGPDGLCCGAIDELCNNCINECPCLLAGTSVAMAGGLIKPIEEIAAGDNVLSFDEKTQQFKQAKVTQTFVHDTDKYLLINGHLKITPNHSVLSNGTWVEIGTLKIGDSLLDKTGNPVAIQAIETIIDNVKVYNIEVDGYHSYVAGGYVMHNKSKCPSPNPPPPGWPPIGPNWCVWP
ncbi:MAG TPA: polymorphic toxin-type HINT domain-containing protein [Candidatus Omnitrophota bacterium]|nr:polymorphic toxin-type HINT domain-containing protein [Candidatus Omnitrophota bacterium]HPD85427.1 polymorphic toxin-type HINT domain-containing protein [Candidatus Omnitrophota bacterium]HRZ04072.1 polymorphic toxin-type HINT domain-containing protein [Candidatus Omnitrophota bacterium]